MHLMIIGLLLGWGAAIPVGPICLEMIRRNLVGKTRHGIMFGFGACFADVTYIAFLVLGAMMILTHPEIIKVIGLLGALVLIWFGVSAFRAVPLDASESMTTVNKALWAHGVEGYALTLLNPMTILFWASVSAQLAALSEQSRLAIIQMGSGVFLGAFSWVLCLNIFLHFTHRYIPIAVMRNLNRVGGCLLLVFAGICLWKVVV